MLCKYNDKQHSSIQYKCEYDYQKSLIWNILITCIESKGEKKLLLYFSFQVDIFIVICSTLHHVISQVIKINYGLNEYK